MAEKKKLEHWKSETAEILGYARSRQLEFWGQDGDESEDDDIVPPEMLDAVKQLDREQYDVPAMITETFRDLNQLAHFTAEARKFEPTHDDKLQKLSRLLKTKELADQKVLVFTEFADTARYLKRQLDQAGIDGVAQVDSASPGNRADVIQRFSPYYNSLSSPALVEKGRTEIRVLISTDVLSEGLNLQDASRMINYDIHWNPVRLMQRIGRVDRRMNPEIEQRLVADHAEVAGSRGTVSFWNFLPPDELNAILTLYTKVTQKTLLISKTLGIEGKKLLTPQDNFAALKEFNHTYEGTKTAVEDMHLEYQALLQADPELEARLKRLPGATVSGRKRAAHGARGVFFCYALPRPGQGGRRVHRGGGHDPLVPLRPRPRRDSRRSGRDRWQHLVHTRDAAPVHHRGEDPGRDSDHDREAHQKQLPEARGCPGRRQAAAALLDGVERGLSRCRPTTAAHSRASSASTSSSPTCATKWAGRSTAVTSRS